MSRPRLAVLLAAHDAADARRNLRRELDADLAEFHAPAGELPDHHDFDGVVVSGSRASVYDDAEWIDATRAWVRGALDRELPCLGICWGHQLLADVLGGRVEPMDAYELGYRSVRRRGDSELLDGIGEEFVAFATHSDEVVALPPGARLLAENDRSVHAFRAGSAVGVQFHPEYDRETAHRVTRGKESQADAQRVRAALATIDEERVDAAREAKQLFENFLAVVEDAREAGDGARSGASAD